MSETEHQEAQETEQKKKPSHIAYQVNETENGKSFFNRVGSAFAHKDGKGFNVVLQSTPVDGRITLRSPQERLQQTREGKADKGAEHEPSR